MTNYDWITDDMFDSKLIEILDEHPASHLLKVPGIVEIVSEHFNNDVLDALEEGRCVQ